MATERSRSNTYSQRTRGTPPGGADTVGAQLAYINSLLPQATTHEVIVELHFALDALEYLVCIDCSASAPTPAPVIANPVCAAPACPADWRTGLINAALGHHDPVWYCAAHMPRHNANGKTAPPGTSPPKLPQLQLARDMAKAWTAHLSRLELDVNHNATD